MRGTCASAMARVCASAPARGGSMTMASNAFSSDGSSGRRNRSRTSVVTGFSPCAWRAALSSAVSSTPSPSTA
jgi:hypothetical protein